MKNILVWFRNDLRLHDNLPLYQASLKAEKIYFIYCIDTRWFEETHLGFKKTDIFRTKFLLESLASLRMALRKKGSDLIIRVGKPEIEVAKVAEMLQVQAVFASKETTNEETLIEFILEKHLENKKVRLELFWNYTLYHLDDLPFPIQKLPNIFTEFRKCVEKDATLRSVLPTVQHFNPISHDFLVGEIPSLTDLGFQDVSISNKQVLHFKGGEKEGILRLQEYFWETDSLKTYKETRDSLLGANYSSKFSAWLSLGCLSPRYIYQEVKKYEKERIKNDSTYWLIFELIWRDYFRFVAKKYGNQIFQEFGIKQNSLQFKNDIYLFKKWIKGETGVDFIDANMRELNQTGFMSNRGRQNVASFLVKDLQISWIWGAMYFESKLIDYDPCSNWCNWMYIAGVGNDPRENRYFNIESQAKKYDAKGLYVKFWLSDF
ncbi:MAG: DASH family cryptochrome [Raineya sp.]|jgi:deoxyribodipyrimidine photo-lyase|nr:DASH family cryptochrome [Raineya sp.]